jgi:anti-sigma factor RsiW
VDVAKSNLAEELEPHIESFLDGSLKDPLRSKFKAHLEANPEFRKQVESTTRSIEMVKLALERVEPENSFEEKVSSKIVNITQSNPKMRPYALEENSGGASSSTNSPAVAAAREHFERSLRADPEADGEKRRLIWLAIIAAILFAAGAILIVTAYLSQRNTVPAPTQAPIQ